MTSSADTLPTPTPADEGILAAALDDARRDGLGDDASTDRVRDALVAEAGFSHADASALAYRAVHAIGRPKSPAGREHDR